MGASPKAEETRAAASTAASSSSGGAGGGSSSSEEESTEEEKAKKEKEKEKAAALAAARKLVDEAEGIETVTLDPAAHAAAAAFVDAEQRRAAPVIAYLPWARIVCEIAQDYKCDLTYEAAVFAAMYKLVEAKVVGVLAAADVVAENAGRMRGIPEDARGPSPRT